MRCMKFFAGFFVLRVNASTSSSLLKVATKQADGPCTTESANSNPSGARILDYGLGLLDAWRSNTFGTPFSPQPAQSITARPQVRPK